MIPSKFRINKLSWISFLSFRLLSITVPLRFIERNVILNISICVFWMNFSLFLVRYKNYIISITCWCLQLSSRRLAAAYLTRSFFSRLIPFFSLSYIRFSAVELAIKVSENRFSFYVNVWIIIHGIFTSMRGESAWILRIANSTELQLLYYFRILLIQCIYRITCPCGKKERVANEHICIDIKLWWS